MGNMHLITGYAGQEHITAADQGAFNAALIGRDQFVLDVGNALKAQVISNNQIRILDGELMMQGRFVRLDPGTYVDLNIDNGAQGVNRNDLIVARYTKNTSTGVENVDLVVIKGTAAASNPADPAHTEGDITNGAAVLHDYPLWRIPLNGLNVGEPVALFGEPFMDSMRTLPGIRRSVESIHTEVDKQLAEQDAAMAKKIAGLEGYTKEEVLTDTTKAAYGLGSAVVPNDVFALIKTTFDASPKIACGTYAGTGVRGASHPNTLTFNFEPKLVVISGKGSDNHKDTIVLVRGVTADRVQSSADYHYGFYFASITWGAKSVSWYATVGDETNATGAQANTSGETYYYFAIG